MLNHAPTELLRLDDLAVLVEAAVRAHAVGKLSLAALRADGTGRGCDFVVSGTTGMSAGAAHFLLRYCHDLSPCFMSGARGARSFAG